jgi:hypothetical protein
VLCPYHVTAGKIHYLLYRRTVQSRAVVDGAENPAYTGF